MFAQCSKREFNQARPAHAQAIEMQSPTGEWPQSRHTDNQAGLTCNLKTWFNHGALETNCSVRPDGLTCLLCVPSIFNLQNNSSTFTLDEDTVGKGFAHTTCVLHGQGGSRVAWHTRAGAARAALGPSLPAVFSSCDTTWAELEASGMAEVQCLYRRQSWFC